MASITSQPMFLLASNHNSSMKNPNKPRISSFSASFPFQNPKLAPHVSRISISAPVVGKSGAEHCACVSSSISQQTCVPPNLRVCWRRLSPIDKFFVLASFGIGMTMIWSSLILVEIFQKYVKPEALSNNRLTSASFLLDLSIQAEREKEMKEPKKPGSVLSVKAFEKMMEDPTMQKMVYRYLPEEMRNSETLKWMVENPQYYESLLQDTLNNMGGSIECNNRLDSLKYYNLNGFKVKQQSDSIGIQTFGPNNPMATCKPFNPQASDPYGVTREEFISKIVANPDVAVAFQNPRIERAIIECTENFLYIAKYINDKEVMDVINKMSELFLGRGEEGELKEETAGEYFVYRKGS